MKLALEWSKPIVLRDAGRDENLIYTIDDARVTDAAGVYVFGRRFSGTFEALYVGQAKNIRGRVKSHIKNNLSLMLHLQKAKNGKRILLFGRFVAKPGQQEEKCLRLLERAMLRHFLSEGHDLVNKQGARLSRHEITSKNTRKLFPHLMFVDKAKGE